MGDLVEKYIELIVAMNDIDYGSKICVAKNNSNANKIRKIATDIDMKYPELKEKFFLLINHNKNEIKLYAAHHILEVMNYDRYKQEKALEVIKQKAKEDSVDGLGNRMWLEQWQQKLNKMR